MRLFSSKILLKGNPKQWSYAVEDDSLKTMKCTDLIYNGTQFVALGNVLDGLNYVAYTSTSNDGKTWTTPAEHTGVEGAASDDGWVTIAKNNSKYCTMCPSSAGCFVSSGTTLSDLVATPSPNRTLGRNNFVSICVDSNNTFIAMASNGYISTSSDGVTWTTPTSEINASLLKKIFYDSTNNKLIAVGNSKYAVKSNGTWTTYDLFDKNWKTIDYVNGTYSVYATTGEVTTSTDLENWTEPLKMPYISNGKWVATAHSPSVQVLLNNEGYISTKQI